MRKLTAAEVFLLQNWKDTARLVATTAAIESWMFDSVIEVLAHRPWWTKEFYVERYPSRGETTTAIHVLKASWKVDDTKWHWYALGMQDLSPDALLGPAEPPALYVWSPDVERATWKKGRAFDRIFNSAAKRISRPCGLWDENKECVWGYVCRPPQRWLRLLEAGKFAEEVCSEFDKLARLIAPIDRALAKVRPKAARTTV